MIKLNDIKNNLELLNLLNWDILPEEAVGKHLEWGAGWAAHNFDVGTSESITIHFAVNTWDDPPVIHLIRRKGFDSEILATIDIPKHLLKDFLSSIGTRKGIYALEGDIKKWLKSELIEN